ncbi:uncharacterized [Tachysurus ichikawai]
MKDGETEEVVVEHRERGREGSGGRNARAKNVRGKGGPAACFSLTYTVAVWYACCCGSVRPEQQEEVRGHGGSCKGQVWGRGGGYLGEQGALAASLSFENNGDAGGNTIWLTCCQNSTSVHTQEHVVEG